MSFDHTIIWIFKMERKFFATGKLFAFPQIEKNLSENRSIETDWMC